MEKIKLGIIGIGNMGSGHANNIKAGKCPETELVAISDANSEHLEWAKKQGYGDSVKYFNNAEEMLDSGHINACIVATAHYDHVRYAIECMQRGIHVMVEKPAGVYTKQVREMNREADIHPGVVFAMMFNQRTNCIYRKLRELVQSGNYGQIRRTNWIITDWYRPQCYYDSGSWRATWSGEGGGVLLNQCPHQLDLWQWICGMPSKIRAFCSEGKWHDIEVEDDVTIYAEYPNGATGVFITTTGDYPGTNRFEITLDKAKLVCENAEKITLIELEEGLEHNIQNATEGFTRIKTHTIEVETDGKNEQHSGVLNAFAGHILHGTPLVADGKEGINGLTISNAAHLSSWTNETVSIPFDEDKYYDLLMEHVKNSKSKTNVVEQVADDMSDTY